MRLAIRIDVFSRADMSVGGKARNASWNSGVIAVVSAPSITGPWTDPIGLPLVINSARDPGIVQDPNGEYYLVWGVFQYFIARFNEDMTSFAEPPRKIEVIGAIGPFGPGSTDDKPYMHYHGGIYYLSWGCFYATSSSSVYGPFTYRGTVIDPAMIASSFRMRTDPPVGCCSRCADGNTCTAGCSCAVHSEPALNPAAQPKVGDGLQLNSCSTAKAAHWTRLVNPRNSSQFALKLRASQLCVSYNSSDPNSFMRLRLATCNTTDSQQVGFSVSPGQFPADVWTRTGTAILQPNNASYIHGPSSGYPPCECLEIKGNGQWEGGPHGQHAFDGAPLQCAACENYTNQANFHFHADGTIRPLASFGAGFCLSTNFSANPTSNVTAAQLYEDYMLAPSWFGKRDFIDRHGAFFNHSGQWFFVMNDESHSLDPASYFFRDSVASYVHYNDDGSIAPVTIDGTGVGEYDGTTWIEAECFMRVSGKVIKRQQRDASSMRANAFEVILVGPHGELHYPNILHDGATKLSLRAIAVSVDGSPVQVEVRELLRSGSVGRRLTVCSLSASERSAEYVEHACHLSTTLAPGVGVMLRMHDATPGTGTELQLDSFRVQRGDSTAMRVSKFAREMHINSTTGGSDINGQLS